MIWKKNLSLEISSELAYKTSFFIRCIGLMLFGLFGPIVTMLIYSNTNGIAGWTFWEFMLFQGTGVFIWGLCEFSVFSIVWRNMEMIRRGTFDRMLVTPFRTLILSTLHAIDLDGFSRMLVGLSLVIVSLIKLSGIGIFSVGAYLFIVLLAFIFMYSFSIITGALAFLVTKSFGLFSIFVTAEEYTRFPLTVYGPTIGFVLSFVLPFGLASFYPAQVILGRLAWSTVGWLTLSVGIFFGVALLFWCYAMRKYSSAGG